MRITRKASGNVYYLRTHVRSTMSIATGKKSVSTHSTFRLSGEGRRGACYERRAKEFATEEAGHW
jgi:hypothetical protein